VGETVAERTSVSLIGESLAASATAQRARLLRNAGAFRYDFFFCLPFARSILR